MAKDDKKDIRKTTKGDLEKRRRKQRSIRRIVVSVVVLVIVAGGVMVLTRSKKGTTSAAPSSPTAPGCTAVEDVGPFNPESEDGSHSGLQPLDRYPSVPPASGPHIDGTVAAGVYDTPPADIATAIHSLEHGAIEVWYSPSVADSPELATIKAFVMKTPENTDHTIVAPWDYPDQGKFGQLPDGDGMVLTAWHTVMRCRAPSLAVVQDFMSKYRYPPLGDANYIGQAPEQGVPI